MVEEEFSKVGRISGGPHQRRVGIWVLQATAMPSILVETGFITNPQEEDYLNSESGQEEIAQCITKALGNYIAWVQKKQPASVNSTGDLPKQPARDTGSAYSMLQGIEQQEKRKISK
jgi:N-acetylmuramoyl-L-alanine amidase